MAKNLNLGDLWAKYLEIANFSEKIGFIQIEDHI